MKRLVLLSFLISLHRRFICNVLTDGMVIQLSFQVLNKLNFPTDQNLYKHLIPINVNDSALDVQTKKHYRKKKNAATSTEPEPYLVDYLRPIKPIEHRLSLDNDEIDARTLRKPDRNNYRNTYEFYQRHLCPNNSTKKSMSGKEV